MSPDRSGPGMPRRIWRYENKPSDGTDGGCRGNRVRNVGSGRRIVPGFGGLARAGLRGTGLRSPLPAPGDCGAATARRLQSAAGRAHRVHARIRSGPGPRSSGLATRPLPRSNRPCAGKARSWRPLRVEHSSGPCARRRRSARPAGGDGGDSGVGSPVCGETQAGMVDSGRHVKRKGAAKAQCRLALPQAGSRLRRVSPDAPAR